MAKTEITIKRLNPKGAETKYVGFEPEWRTQPDDSNRISAFANAFQWYGYHYGKKEAKDMIAHYLEANAKGDIRTGSKLPFTPTPYAPTPLIAAPAPANAVSAAEAAAPVGNKAGGLLSIKHRRRA
jgi:hypothetical protein